MFATGNTHIIYYVYTTQVELNHSRSRLSQSSHVCLSQQAHSYFIHYTCSATITPGGRGSHIVVISARGRTPIQIRSRRLVLPISRSNVTVRKNLCQMEFGRTTASQNDVCTLLSSRTELVKDGQYSTVRPTEAKIKVKNNLF